MGYSRIILIENMRNFVEKNMRNIHIIANNFNYVALKFSSMFHFVIQAHFLNEGIKCVVVNNRFYLLLLKQLVTIDHESELKNTLNLSRYTIAVIS